MAVKQAELCRAWGLSRGRVSQMVKAGLPLASLEEAAAWRIAHVGGSSAQGLQCRIDKSHSSNNGDAVLNEKPKPIKLADISREDFTGTLARLMKNEMIAWGMLAAAVRNRDETEILIRERHYKEAVGLRVSQEGKVDEILMRRGELVTLAEAKELFGRHLQSLRLSLKTLPSRLAARCNPSDPELAKITLTEAIDRIFKILNEWDA